MKNRINNVWITFIRISIRITIRINSSPNTHPVKKWAWPNLRDTQQTDKQTNRQTDRQMTAIILLLYRDSLRVQIIFFTENDIFQSCIVLLLIEKFFL